MICSHERGDLLPKLAKVGMYVWIVFYRVVRYMLITTIFLYL